MSTWGYRVVEVEDVDGPVYCLREVYYGDDHVPTGMGDVLLTSSKRDFSDVRQQLDEAIRRPVHDPANPFPAPRSYRGDVGYLPGSEEDKAIPLKLREIIAYQRNAADDLADAIRTQADTLSPDMIAVAKMDREFALRIAKTLSTIPDLDAIRDQLYGYLEQARAIAQAQPPTNPDDMAKDLDKLDGILENASGLLGMIGLPPGPDGCQVCKGARGGAPGNENVVDGVVMCDWCSVDSDRAKRGKPEGTNCWVPPALQTPDDAS